MIPLPSPKILLFTLGCLAVLCAALVGYRVGVGSQPVRLAAASPDAGLAAEQQQVQAISRARDVAEETVRQLQTSLAEAQRLADDDKAELDLYRRIASDATPSGLSIDSVALDRDAMAITLIQSRGRKSVNGVVKIVLTRVNNDQVERLILPSEAGSDEIEFDFRFFQTLNVPMVAVDGFTPQRIEITVRPNGNTYKEIKADFDWEDVNP